MVNNGFDSFNTPLTPLRFQSSLGKESERRYKEGKNIVRLTLAKVAKINYKYNTVDVVTTIYKNTTSKNPEDNGRFSARLPVSFGGRTPDGKVYGANTLVTVGSLVLIGFLEGSKDYPIVLNIYGDLDNQSQLTRTTFTSADESDEAIQRELWQLFNLYPSMTYQSIDGHGNQEITFSGKTFMYVTDSDPENEYVQDAGFDYDHLPSSRYANGELIEPKSSKSPTLLYVHQGVYDDHRVTFFIKSDGTVRYGSRHLDGGGITYHEMKTDGSFNLTQKIGTTNPEEEGTKQSSIGIDEDGNIILETYKGAYLNGRSLGALGGDIDLGNLEEGILDARASIDILKDQIKFTASRTELDNLTEKIMEQEASFIVAYNEISSRVTRNEYHNLARPSANLLHNTTFTNTLLPYGEGTQLTVAEKDVNELTVRRAGASSEFGVYIGHAKPMKLAKGKEYTLSFEGDFEPISSINKLSIVTKEGVKQELPELEVQALGEEDEYPRYQVTFTSEETYEDNAYLLLAVESTESDSFTIRKVQIEEGDEATPWYPSYKDFDIVDRYDTEIAQLADSISLTANSVKSIGESVDGLSGDMGKALARINEAELKITPEAITSTVRESDAYLADLLAAREYAEEMAGLVAIEVGEVYESLGDLNEFINGAFHDGIISEAEAQAISKYINILETEKADVTAKYDQIYNTPELEGTIKSTLSTAKNNYNTAHSQLIATINSAIEDMHTTPEESLAVDQAFGDYRRRLAALSDVLEMAIDSIAQAKANAAEQKAKEHADGLYSTTSSQIEQLSSEINMRVTEETYNAGLKDAKDYAADLFIPISLDLTELSDVLSDLDTYIDGAFRDGVIEESEAKAIQKYLNILKSEKVDVDVRYNEIYTNSDLPEDIRSEIQAAKGAFDTSHTNLITSINNAIRDGKTTIDEALDVDVKFNAYSNTLANLTGWFETATNTIGTVKSEKAYQKSKEYADGEMGVLSEQIRQAELKITPEAITSTVRKSTEYMDDLKDKVGVEEIISRINQSAEEILIEARRIRISGDTTVENGALRWEYSSGGTLVLGGEENQNGVLEVYDSEGDLIADLDGDRGGFSTLTVADLTVTDSLDAPGLVTAIDEDLVIYVAGSRGSDDNDGTSASPLYSIEEAISRIPNYVNSTVEIRLLSGYDVVENPRFSGFTGSGDIELNLNGQTIKGYVSIVSCTLAVRVYGGAIERSSGTVLVSVDTSLYTVFRNLVLNGGGGTTYGFRVRRNSKAYLGDGEDAVEIYNVSTCIFVGSVAEVYSYRAMGLGSNYGVRVETGSTIRYGIRTPMGSNQNTSVVDSGLEVGTYQGSAGTARPPAPPVKEVTTKWKSSSASQWYAEGGWHYRGSTPIQGKWDRFGPYSGFWFFGSGMRNTLRGTKIKRVRIRPKRENRGGYSAGVGVTFRLHSYSSRPTGQPSLSNTSHTVNFSRGQRKWVTLPSSFHSLFSNGSWYGVGVHTTSTAGTRYAIMNSSLEVEVTYETT